MDDDLDDLINDIDGTGGTKGSALKLPAYNYEIPTSSKVSSSIQQVNQGGKCYPLYLGGTALQDGQTLSSLNPRSCTKLRCYNCDKPVHRYVESRWKSSVDYFFVRNHNTNTKELIKVRQSKIILLTVN